MRRWHRTIAGPCSRAPVLHGRSRYQGRRLHRPAGICAAIGHRGARPPDAAAWPVARARELLASRPRCSATGVVYAATVTLFVLSTKLTTAANAIFLQATAPLYLLLLGPLVLHERFRARDVAFLLGVAAGLVLCVIGQAEPTTTAPDPVRGNLLAVLCSITWALTLLGLRYIQRDQTQTGAGLSAVTLGNLFASLAAWPFAWPLPAASVVEWSTIVYLGVCQIGVAYVFLTAAMRVLPALEVSLSC